MKLKFQDTELETGGSLEEHSFGIKSCDMGIILETLRSKMYSNPIAAICREISANSRDANRESNKEHNPISISIEHSVFSPGGITINFSDDGPGISPERIVDVFINYGSSTKRDTNKLTGGFGFGSKTPFAKTDSFAIITKVDKIRYTYIAAIEANRTGKIYLMSKEDTSEENGTKIVIPIKKEDRSKFEEESIKTTYFWKVRPEYINFDSSNRIREFQRKDVYNDVMVTSSVPFFYDGAYLLIDTIPYELDTRTFGIIIPNSTDIFISFRTGVLTVSANRESVQYDEATIQHIKKKFDSFLAVIKSDFVKRIEICPTYIDACLELMKFKDDPKFAIVKANKFDALKFKGQEIKTSLSLQSLRIRKISKGGFESKEWMEKYDPSMKTLPIYFVDTPRTGKSRNATIFKTNREFFIIELADKGLRKFSELPLKQKKLQAKKMRAALNELKWLKDNGLNFSNYSAIEQTRETKTAAASLDTLKVKVVDHNLRFKRRDYDDFSNHRKKIAYCLDGDNEENKKWAAFLSNNFEIIVLFVGKRAFKTLKTDHPTLDTVKNSLDPVKVKEIANNKYIYDSSFDTNQLDVYEKLSFKNGIGKNIKLLKTFKRNRCFEFNKIPSDFYNVFKPDAEFVKAIEELKTVETKYPLILYAERYNTANIKEFNRYINLIDNEEKLKLNQEVA